MRDSRKEKIKLDRDPYKHTIQEKTFSQRNSGAEKEK